MTGSIDTLVPDGPADGPPRPRAATALERLARRQLRHDAQSAFTLLTSGRDALPTLLDLAACSERTLDLQYYLWRKDDTGQLLMSTLLDAADRGVRVRVLLDGWEPSWSDAEIAALSTHDRLEIRLFNPALSRRHGILNLLRNPARITHRMHNKAFIADRAMAVLGGRNVSDLYFSVCRTGNYRDVDVLAAGAVLPPLAASFDAYWNSPWSQPVMPRPRLGVPSVDLPGLRRTLHRRLDTAGQVPIGPLRGRPIERLEERLADVVRADAADVTADPPSKAATSEPTLLRDVRRKLAERLDSELLIESAYLIPRGRGLRSLSRLARQGISVRILTNSLLSSDAATTYAGYQRFRRRLLRNGVELYELRGRGGADPGDQATLGEQASAKLHSKTAVVDRRYVFIGSFNADPRSVNLNTEVALLIDSPELATRVAGFIEDGMHADRAFRLGLQRGRLVWRGTVGGADTVLRREPGRTFWRSVWLRLLSMLPIEDQL